MTKSLLTKPLPSTGSVAASELPMATSQSSEELIAKSIAPVKKEYLCPPPARSSPTAVEKDEETTEDKPQPRKLVQEKKSKRQMKRDRLEEKKSKLNLCPVVAKNGDATSCPHGSNCRFSHDLESYQAQKPDDLEGVCPFIASEKSCPYGLACRFLGTHINSAGDSSENGEDKVGTEVNGLQKDVQRLLWKNRMKFPKADASLKHLGIAAKDYSKPKGADAKEEEDLPKASAEPNCLEGNGHTAAAADESRPLKKSKSVNGDSTSKGPKKLAEEIPETDASLKIHRREKKLIDFSRKLYLAPLTTVGNLPFRRLCKALGADVTCGEMAMCTNLLQGQASEWALLRRHSSEDLFGVQICGAFPDTVARTIELIDQECSVDFIDINMGCPIDIVVDKGAGSALMTKPVRMKNVIQAASAVASTPITVKVRTGYIEGRNRVDKFIEDIADWGASALTIHGRSRQQRYSKAADWQYIGECVEKAPNSLQVIGNGDVGSYLDWNKHFSDCPKLSSNMIARGALVKPWIFTEIKEQRNWDISSGERLDILKDYVRFGLHHWGSDTKGVETTRHFLLQWLSYSCRYVPVGLLDVVPQQLNWRPPSYFGRNELETLMASESAADWIRISEMVLGKVPEGFAFAPKHKSNAYNSAENG